MLLFILNRSTGRTELKSVRDCSSKAHVVPETNRMTYATRLALSTFLNQPLVWLKCMLQAHGSHSLRHSTRIAQPVLHTLPASPRLDVVAQVELGLSWL